LLNSFQALDVVLYFWIGLRGTVFDWSLFRLRMPAIAMETAEGLEVAVFAVIKSGSWSRIVEFGRHERCGREHQDPVR
jgi:hypothetical protein